MYFAIVMLIILTCFPITMCFPSSIRYTLQITAMFVFFIGLILSRNKSALLLFVIIVAVMLIRVLQHGNLKKLCIMCILVYMYLGHLPFMALGYINKITIRNVKNIFLLFALTTITAVTTIIGLQHHPLVVRELRKRNYGLFWNQWE